MRLFLIYIYFLSIFSISPVFAELMQCPVGAAFQVTYISPGDTSTCLADVCEAKCADGKCIGVGVDGKPPVYTVYTTGERCDVGGVPDYENDELFSNTKNFELLTREGSVAYPSPVCDSNGICVPTAISIFNNDQLLEQNVIRNSTNVDSLSFAIKKDFEQFESVANQIFRDSMTLKLDNIRLKNEFRSYSDLVYDEFDTKLDDFVSELAPVAFAAAPRSELYREIGKFRDEFSPLIYAATPRSELYQELGSISRYVSQELSAQAEKSSSDIVTSELNTLNYINEQVTSLSDLNESAYGSLNVKIDNLASNHDSQVFSDLAFQDSVTSTLASIETKIDSGTGDGSTDGTWEDVKFFFTGKFNALTSSLSSIDGGVQGLNDAISQLELGQSSSNGTYTCLPGQRDCLVDLAPDANVAGSDLADVLDSEYQGAVQKQNEISDFVNEVIDGNTPIGDYSGSSMLDSLLNLIPRVGYRTCSDITFFQGIKFQGVVTQGFTIKCSMIEIVRSWVGYMIYLATLALIVILFFRTDENRG